MHSWGFMVTLITITRKHVFRLGILECLANYITHMLNKILCNMDLTPADPINWCHGMLIYGVLRIDFCQESIYMQILP